MKNIKIKVILIIILFFTASVYFIISNKEIKILSQSKNTPKYVFLFIGDGMSYTQIQLAGDYLGALEQKGKILSGNKKLSFMKFPVAGSAVTYDSTSYCPDSASSGTALATGHKTESSVINMDETGTKKYKTIAEKLKKQLGYKIGIITSVNLNHATPAAFYAHQPSRTKYYEIGRELIQSNFDFFAGGSFLSPNGGENLYALAAKAGYKVVKKQAEAKKISEKNRKLIIIGETLDEKGALPYAIDSQKKEWKLKDYVSKGINVINNKKGFFMMVEGGKIDWAGHANDAGTVMAETLAFSDAVEEAVKFYNKHPKQTLIIVTGDHETGGLSIGYAGTEYDTYLSNFKKQKISFSKFNSKYVAKYKLYKTDFQMVLKDIYNNFGLKTEDNKLKTAYDKTINEGVKGQEDDILYGEYEPLTVTITHILANKSGINFSSYYHTGLPAAVFAKGTGSALFNGYYDNTEVYNKMASLLNIK